MSGDENMRGQENWMGLGTVRGPEKGRGCHDGGRRDWEVAAVVRVEEMRG